MKFGKEFASKMVQEWQGAYMDYNGLKEILEDLKSYRQHSRTTSAPTPSGRSRSLKRRQTMHRAFSGLTARPKDSPTNKDEVIIINEVEEERAGTYYQTMFLKSAEDGGPKELIFFKRLDDEFNKVLKFYREKVEGAKMAAEELSKQMDALIALRIRVNKPNVEQKFSPETKDSGGSSPTRNRASVHVEEQGVYQMEGIPEDEIRSEGTSEPKILRTEKTFNRFRPPPIEILEHVKINVHPETPVSTLKNVVGSSKLELSFSREELKKTEAKLRKAFIEFYQQLRLLKSYCFLNMLAFSKIMKKYDKITSRGASKTYLEMVDKSCLGSSDEVNKLIERLEATFIKHFAKSNRGKGMKSLRPGCKKERHRVTFFLGLFTGCSIALIAAIVLIVRAQKLFNHEGRQQYMDNIFPLYSLFAFILLHMLMYGANTYLWRRYLVNYPFIFGFKSGTELGFREVFLIASGLSVLALAAVLSNLNMEMDQSTKSYEILPELVPLGLVIVVLLIMFCPFNIIYRSSRFFLLRCTWHCIFTPLYKVTLPDFFLADQLTSQVQAFRTLELYVTYYVWGDIRKRLNEGIHGNAYESLYFVVAIIPFWCRALQCLRRLFEEKDGIQGLNALKYFSTIVALVMRTIYDQRKGTFWRVMAASTSGLTTISNTYWDIVIDWGLLQKNAKNPWLRDQLLLSNKAVYFVAIVVNILLRLVWMQLVLDYNGPDFLHKKATITFVACLEILRRGIWNFFRLENEHFNNVGKYRAFKTVPLPFHLEDGEEEDI